MRIRLEQSTDAQALLALQALLFPHDDRVRLTANTRAWLGYIDSSQGSADAVPVAFCTARLLPGERAVFLERAGVMPLVRGKGLQRRLIRVREQWAKKIGAEAVITYVAPHNFASIANLIKAGYRLYEPQGNWGVEGALYFEKELT